MSSQDEHSSDKPSEHQSSSSSRRSTQGGERRRSSRFAKLTSASRDTSATDRAKPDPFASPVPTGVSPALDQFRASQRRLKIHPLEVALLWTVGAHLVFLPWALGTMRLPMQVISLLFSVVSIALALVPRTYSAEHTGAAEFRLLPWPKLFRFPIFWLGLVLLGLVTLHGLNPAWTYHTNGKTWWMTAIPHITWLPSGVRVPFVNWGPWRMLIIYASGWLTVCAIWIGFTRRRTVQRLFIALAVNGLALAILGLAQRILSAGKIFWFIDSSNPSFFSSFVYKNHAGGYLLLILAVACGLVGWYYLRGVRRLEKSNPSGLFAFFVTCIAVSVLVSYARGATFVMLAYLCVVVAAFIFYQTRLPKEARSPVIAVALLIVFGFFLKTGLNALHSELAWDRLRSAMSGNDLSVQARKDVTKAAAEMLGDNWVKGVGSGGFMSLFPIYQHRHPEIVTLGGGRVWWEHAHNDVLQIPIELGLPGVLIILAGFAYWTVTLLRSYAWQNPLSACVILGCLFLIGMSWGDFVFQCPAILITWCALWPACALWAKLEEQRGRL